MRTATTFLEAIGGPFQISPDLPLQDWKSICSVDHELMKAPVVLIEACQLERLYRPFGYGPTTWNEAVAGGVGREMDLSSGRSVTRVISRRVMIVSRFVVLIYLGVLGPCVPTC